MIIEYRGYRRVIQVDIRDINGLGVLPHNNGESSGERMEDEMETVVL